MSTIFTLTVNPAIDKSTSVKGIVPNKKLRCAKPVFDAGGGGINVSRAIAELGGNSVALYFAGGPSGTHLSSLLKNESIDQEVIQTKAWTRENLSVTDTLNNHQYRFGMPGPKVSELEYKQVFDFYRQNLKKDDILVASGSLAPGMPEDFYKEVGKLVKEKKGRFILDTSGKPLLKGIEAGVFLLKPNLGELSSLCGVEKVEVSEIRSLANDFFKKYNCEILVVSMGARGAVLLTHNKTVHVPAPAVHQQSTIGAGDSMVGGMVLNLSLGRSLAEILRYGVACGTAATMNPGTRLFEKKDVERLYQWISSQAEEKFQDV